MQPLWNLWMSVKHFCFAMLCIEIFRGYDLCSTFTSPWSWVCGELDWPSAEMFVKDLPWVMSFIAPNVWNQTKSWRIPSKLGCNNVGYMAFLHICGLFDFMFHDAPGLTAAGWVFDLRCVHPETTSECSWYAWDSLFNHIEAVNILVTGWESTPKSNGDTGWQLPHESLATALVEELASNVQEALTIFLVCSELLDASCKYLLYHLQIPSQVRKILRCAGEFSSPCGGFARLTCLGCSSSAAVSNTRNWLLGILANVLVDQDLPW